MQGWIKHSLAATLSVFLAAIAIGGEGGAGHAVTPLPPVNSIRIVSAPRQNLEPPRQKPARPMELRDFEEFARRYNPTLIQAISRVEATRAEWVQAGLYPNPHVAYEAHEMNDEGQAGQQGAGFTQEFVTAGKLRRSRDVATHVLRQAEHALAAQHGRVMNDVRHAFYEVLAAQLTLDLAERLVAVGQEGVQAAEQLFRAQEVSRVDVLQARIEADTAHILAAKARNRRRAAWRNLAVVIGVPDMPQVELSGDIQQGISRLTWRESLDRILSTSPVLAEARAGVDRAKSRVGRELAERIPNFDLQAGVLYDNATRDTIAEVQAGVALPLFNRNQGNIRKAEVELASARGEVRRIALVLQQRLALAFERYENARCIVDKYAREMLPDAKTTLDLVTIGYRHGEFDYVTLLTAQRTYFQVNMAYVDALRELRMAFVLIEGDLLGGSLERR